MYGTRNSVSDTTTPAPAAVTESLSLSGHSRAASDGGRFAETSLVARLQLLRDVAAFTRNVDPDTIARLAAADGHSLTESQVRSHFAGSSVPTEQDLRAYRIVLGYGEQNWKLFSTDPAVYAPSVQQLQTLLVALRQQYYHGMRRITP